MFMLIFQEKLHSILIKKIWHKKHISDPYDLHEPISDEQFVCSWCIGNVHLLYVNM